MSRIQEQRTKIRTVRPRLEVLEDRVLPSTVSWVSSTSGEWTTATNWSTGAVPAAGDDVVINQSAAVTVTLAVSTSVHSLSLTGATLNVTGGTLAVAADSSNAGSLQVQPGAHATLAGNYLQSAAGSLTLPAAGLTTGVGTNLLTNSGFESPSHTTTAPSGWASWGTSNVSSQYAHTGAQSLQEYGSNSGVLESFAVTPGTSYTGTVYAMTPATNPLTGPEGAFLEVIFYDASGNQITPYSPPNSVNILSSTSATGGPIAGSVGNQGWNSFSNTEVAPSNAASVHFILETGAYTGLSGTAGGAVFWDDPQFGITASNGGVGTNLLTNSGFESPSVTTTAPSGWASWGTSYLSSQFAHTGAQSLQESGPNSGVLESFAVTPGVSYTGTVYAMTPATNPLTGPEGGFLQVIFYDASGNQISPYSSPNSVTILSSTSATGGPFSGSVGNQGWNYFSTTAVAPANAAKVNFVLETGAYTGLSGTAGGAVLWDDPQFGPTAANAATLRAVNITNNGTITIGPGDTVAASGTFTQTSSGTLAVQLGGPPASGLYGALSAAGTATLAGTLQAALLNGYTPAVSDGFNALTYPSVTGTFATYQLLSGPSYNFAAAVNPTYVGLAAVPTQLSTTVNAGTVVGPVATNMLGVNLAWWDDKLTTPQTQQMVQAAGLIAFRFPGGSSSDDYHFNVSSNFGDSAANTIPQFAHFIESVGGTGLVTLDYGSGSPQEAAAELAYLEGSPTDTTVIGTGPEWNDSTSQWKQVNWQTVTYWASLRAATPLAQDDGYNFLRINHPAAFTEIKDWEVGNEEYGGWEIDHHGTPGPGGVSTGAQHDPATYAAFAHAFAGYAAEIDAGISIGIDSGDPGAGYNNWTKNVLTQGQAIGFVPGFISDHSYMQGPGQESDSTLLLHTVSDPNSILDWSTRHADYLSLLQTTLGSQASGVQVMATEFNSVYTNPGKQSTSLVNGLFIADSIGSLLDSGYTGGFVWDLRNGWDPNQNNSPTLYGWRQGGDYGLLGDPNTSAPPSTGPYVPYPNYFAEQLASKIVQTGGQVVSASSNFQDLAAYAVLEANGHLELLVINKNPDANLNEQFTLQGFTPNGQAQVWQYGESQDYAQSQTTDGFSALANSTTTLTLNGSSFNYTFPAYSMTVLDLTPAAATHFAVSAPASATAGLAFAFTLTAQDAFNNTASNYLGTVRFTTSAAKAVLPASYTFTAADAGVHTFSATLRSAGSQSITATDTLNSSISGSQTIAISPAATHHLVVSQFPSKTTAGVAQNLRVTAQDMFGNTTPSFADTVSFSSTDAKSVLPANYTFTSGDAGIHFFSATLKTVGSQSITVQDVTNPNVLAGTRTGIVVNPAAASSLQVSGFPSSVTAGTAYNFNVTAFDPYGNIATGYRGTVMFTSSDGAASLPANYPFTSSDAGAHTFAATLNTPGTQSIIATDTVNAGIMGTESGIVVVSLQPTAGISGRSIGVPGQPLVYTLSATESGLSSGTTYSFSVQWGDGSPVQTVSGTSGTQVGHAFTTPDNDTISVIATDSQGHASTPASTSVSVTTVAMETDPSNSSLTALYVGGTLGNDTIAITPVANGGVMVGMNYVNYGSFFPTGHVVVYSQSGNDIIKTAAQTINGALTYVNVPVLFFAGNGNDILNVTGSSANNVLVGGGGTDRLLGGQGRDILIGGAGQATLEAGAGGDILIGGTTAYDNNAAALAALLAEWASADDYATRVARLAGSMTGGLNGTYYLNSSTVQSNGLADKLYGGPGMDWFFAGMMDVIFNRTSGEVDTPI